MRVAASKTGSLAAVAYCDPDGARVLLVLNAEPVVCDPLTCTRPVSGLWDH